MTPLRQPDVLVLGGGGVLGEAWMTGVLAGIEAASSGAVDFTRCDAYVGTSAGSIVAARLASGRSPRRPADARAADAEADFEAGERDGSGTAARVVRGAARLGAWASAPFAGPVLAVGAAPGARLRALALARVPSRGERLTGLHRRVGEWGVRFDGRLRICAVDRATGRRVVFGRPGAPRASVADAVLASCAIPWVFRPVVIGGREYVDGGAWSFSNLDAAPAGRDSEVLCLNPASVSLDVARSSPLAAARGLAGAAVELEALALRARAARVRVIGPDAGAAARMGSNFMDPAPAADVTAAGYAQGLRLGRGA